MSTHQRPLQPDPLPGAGFEDLLEANQGYAADFTGQDLPGRARAGIAVVTCMDARIDPLAILGLSVGDAKVLRNAGGRVTETVLGELVLAVDLLGAERVLVICHTRCAMGSATQDQMRERVSAATGQDASWLGIGTVADPEATLRDDVRRVRAHPLLAAATVGGFRYDVDTGQLAPVC